MSTLLEVRDVTQIFGNPEKAHTVALNHLTFTISGETPSFTAVVGESGSGKTTLARILLGFQKPTSGEVFYRGANMHTAHGKAQHTFRHEVQAIFQDPFEVYNPFYKVDHLLTVPVAKFRLAKSRAEGRELIANSLRAVGLRPEETLGRYPHQLSGGQRQRITVARALLLRPRLIIADEPVSMVDASLRATILETLKKLNQDFGISFLYITHDLTTAYQVSDNIIVLYRGSVAETGDVTRVIKDPQHPYTQLLVSSIPQPNPDRRWGENVVAAAGGAANGHANHGCLFADRCPYVMPRCREAPPPLYRMEPYRAASCYLREEGATALEGDITQVFREQALAAGGERMH
ncbi:MAG: ABC transporter ATP-binding protein [Thermomicrobiales bacterium]|jgi:peptide/nickel transport system ATP-binding protein|nr:ABC transporter ATP-binding protein [Thermomicrobiales bacterium]